MRKPQMHYGACITYRPVADFLVGDGADTRPVDRLPSLVVANEDSAEARERSLARSCDDLESQGYRIEAVERFEQCARCHGTGKVPVKPPGWRRRSEPPWYMMRSADCADCPENAGSTPAHARTPPSAAETGHAIRQPANPAHGSPRTGRPREPPRLADRRIRRREDTLPLASPPPSATTPVQHAMSGRLEQPDMRSGGPDAREERTVLQHAPTRTGKPRQEAWKNVLYDQLVILAGMTSGAL